MKKSIGMVMMVVLCLLATVRAGEFAAQDPNNCLTAWTLYGSGVQEARVGWRGILPDIELAIGAQHLDVPDPDVDRWPVRVYLLAHALDAEMLGKTLGATLELPDGNLYAGPFAQYSYDREDEWSGGYVVGGLVDWPRGWQTVVEFQDTLFNTAERERQVVAGLVKRF